MKKLLIFTLSSILCFSLIIPVKAQDHFQLLFKGYDNSNHYFPKHLIKKVGHYYFTRDESYKLYYGTNKNHLKKIDQDTVDSILTNGKIAYYVKAHTPYPHPYHYQIIKVDLATGHKSIMWSSQSFFYDTFALNTLAFKNGLLYFYYEPEKLPNMIGIYNIETNQFTTHPVNKLFLNGNAQYYTSIDSYPSDIASLPIYLHDQHFKKITKLTQSTQLYTKFIGDELYYDYTAVKKQNYYHTIMKYNLKTHKRTKLCHIHTAWLEEDHFSIINYSKKDVTITYTNPPKLKHIAYHKNINLKSR